MRRLHFVLLGLSTAVLTAGCATTPEAAPPTPTPVSTPAIIQQIGYGSNARFTWCENANCPIRTVKTLARLEGARPKK